MRRFLFLDQAWEKIADRLSSTFDYIKYLEKVHDDLNYTEESIAELADAPLSELNDAKMDFYIKKLGVLNALIPLVEKQIKEGGPGYACFEEGYRLLMYDTAIPTFSSMARFEELDFMWSKFKQEERTTLLDVLAVVLSPLVALIVGIMGYMAATKKQKVENMPEPVKPSEKLEVSDDKGTEKS